MTNKVLFVLTSHDVMGDTGGKTGVWLEELAAAYYVIIDGGHIAEIASIKGGEAPIDAASLEAPWLTAAGSRFLADADALAKVRHTRAVSEVTPADFDAVYLVGGFGCAWDFSGNKDLKAVVESLYRRNRVVAGICHGVLGLANALTPACDPLLKDKRVTGFSHAEEVLVSADKIVPVVPESRMVEIGAVYSKADEPFGEYVVRDGTLVTGQNPASAFLLGQTILDIFQESSRPASNA